MCALMPERDSRLAAMRCFMVTHSRGDMQSGEQA